MLCLLVEQVNIFTGCYNVPVSTKQSQVLWSNAEKFLRSEITILNA